MNSSASFEIASVVCGPDSQNQATYTLHSVPDEKDRYEIRTEIPDSCSEIHIVDLITADTPEDARRMFKN